MLLSFLFSKSRKVGRRSHSSGHKTRKSHKKHRYNGGYSSKSVQKNTHKSKHVKINV